MSVVAGKVNAVKGIVQAIDSNTGQIRLLSVGDEVFVDDVIVTSSQGGVNITLQNGELLTLGRSMEMLLDEDVVGSQSDAVTENWIGMDALKQAILEGNIDLEKLEEPAAGEVVSSASDGGEPLVERLASAGEVTSGFDTSGISITSTSRTFQTGFEPPIDALISISSKSGFQNIVEGEASAPFTVSVDQLPENVLEDIIVNLVYSGTAEDGKDFTGVTQVIIKAGTNSVNFTIDTIDDALAEGSENFTISILSIDDNGQFRTVDVDGSASSVDSTITDET
ncbi:retention module-containing protein, partial [Thiomicrorhabdus sp. ZW0627]|uniref:retention module-containing protein n=1 Tax=Thiomicrorhabdus sp. ZW0627 TaxID=3039774 RepID=UPI002436F043